MNKFAKATVALALVFALAPVTSYAAGMNFLGFGFVQPSVCNIHVEHAVYGDEAGQNVLLGCWTQDAMSQADARANALQATGYKFGPLQSVTLKNGTTEICPFWYLSGCVIDRSLIQ